MKVRLRALRGLKGNYGRVNGGQIFETEYHIAKQLVNQGSAAYLDKPPETFLPVAEPQPPEPLPEWPLKTSPEDYIAKYGGEPDLSETIQNNLELAYQHAGGGNAD